jgi:DNA-binding Xre family transcriptional regulator
MTQLDLRYNLKNILRESGMTQLELAKKINISPTNLNTRLARGRNCQLSLLEAICKALDIDMESLMYGENSQPDVVTQSQEGEDLMYRFKFEEAQKKIIKLLEENSALKDELLKNELLGKRIIGEELSG